MNDDNLLGGLLVAVFASVSVMFLVGSRVGYDDGFDKGTNVGIEYCMENQKECKIKYDYLKLQENQK
jgi:hypothetical protein